MQTKTVAFTKKSSNLFFHILTRCNLSCGHCYINRDQHGEATLEIRTIESWLRIFSAKARTTNLVFLGGEPTLHPDLSQAVKIARGMGFRSITIDTNGYLFHRILDRITPEEADVISFSLDGATKETNDRIRGKGCFDAVVSGIGQARQKGFSCAMIYTVSENNIHELEQMPDLAADLGISQFFIQVVGVRGESKDSGARDQVSSQTWRTMIPKVARAMAEKGVKAAYPKVFLDPDEPFECAGMVADNYFVFPNGRVYRCPICEDYPLHSLEIKEDRLVSCSGINERDLFGLNIPEGCVMNRIVQPGNLVYDKDGRPCHKIACCLLKEEIVP